MLDPNIPVPSRRPVDYLEEALYLAERELRESVTPNFQHIAGVAQDLVAFRVGITAAAPESSISLASDPTDKELVAAVAADTRANALRLAHDVQEWPPWVRYAVEFILMEESIDRLQDCSARYTELRAALVDRRIPNPIDETLKELVHLYLWGFDGPAIAMACICFERVAKQALIATSAVTESQLRRDRRSAEELRKDLVTSRFLDDASAKELEHLIRQRNAILHGNRLSESEQEISRRWVAALAHVMQQLHSSWPNGTQVMDAIDT
jgi:hypothetical protein